MLFRESMSTLLNMSGQGEKMAEMFSKVVGFIGTLILLHVAHNHLIRY